jgi:hypothetical protein
MSMHRKDTEHQRTPGAHPVGVGAGATGAGLAGAAIGGWVGGPIGAAVGAAVGAVVGGFGGKAIATSLDLAREDDWWRDNHSDRPYAKPDEPYETYRPAYEFGLQARMAHPDREWDDIEPDLAKAWEMDRARESHIKLGWNDAKHAAKDAWDRVGPPILSSKTH